MMHIILYLNISLIFTSPLFARQRTESCPSPNQRSLENYRQKVIQRTIAGKYDEAQSMIENCFGDDAEKVPACFGTAYDYVNSKIYSITRDEITNAASRSTIANSLSSFPREFLVPDPSNPGSTRNDRIRIPPDIEDVARRRGWPTVAYKTRSSGGFDAPPNLYMVALPNMNNENIDVYMQISPAPISSQSNDNPNMARENVPVHNGQNTLTVIAVDKSRFPPEATLRLLNKAENGTYRWSNSPATSCTSCHSNPLRPISPMGYSHQNTLANGNMEGTLSSDMVARTEAINNLMAVNNLSWQSVFVEKRMPNGSTRRIRTRLGPNPDSHPFGWAPPNSSTRSDQAIRACAERTSFQPYSGFNGYLVPFQRSSEFPRNIRPEVVRNAMNCAQCHNGTVRGYLHAGFDHSELRFKVNADRRMPPFEEGDMLPELNSDERQVLTQCIIDEQSNPEVRRAWQASGAWMSSMSCSGRAGIVSPPPQRRRQAPSDDRPANSVNENGRG